MPRDTGLTLESTGLTLEETCLTFEDTGPKVRGHWP